MKYYGIKENRKYIAKQKVALICPVDNESVLMKKAMLKSRKRDGLKVFCFSSNTSSMWV